MIYLWRSIKKSLLCGVLLKICLISWVCNVVTDSTRVTRGGLGKLLKRVLDQLAHTWAVASNALHSHSNVHAPALQFVRPRLPGFDVVVCLRDFSDRLDPASHAEMTLWTRPLTRGTTTDMVPLHGADD